MGGVDGQIRWYGPLWWYNSCVRTWLMATGHVNARDTSDAPYRLPGCTVGRCSDDCCDTDTGIASRGRACLCSGFSRVLRFISTENNTKQKAKCLDRHNLVHWHCFPTRNAYFSSEHFFPDFWLTSVRRRLTYVSCALTYVRLVSCALTSK